MPVFYLLHEILPSRENEKDSKRNCRTFIIGMFIYCIIYIVIKNLVINNYLSTIMMDALYYTGFILFIADISVMAYTYKSYFGRNILNETLDNDDEWEYNEETKKYKKIKKPSM